MITGRQHFDQIALALSQYYDFPCCDPLTGETLLMHFAMYPHLNHLTTTQLMPHSDLLASDNTGHIALHRAVACDNEPLVIAMLDAVGRHDWSLLLNAVTEHGTYSLSLATKTHNSALVRALLVRGARVLTGDAENALLMAAGKNVDFVICREMLRDLNVEGKYSTENLEVIMYAPSSLGETQDPNLNLWDLLLYWTGSREPDNWMYSPIKNPLLELAWKTACVRELKTPALYSRNSTLFQILYERFVRGWH